MRQERNLSIDKKIHELIEDLMFDNDVVGDNDIYYIKHIISNYKY